MPTLTPVLAFLDVGGPEMLLIFVLILVLFGGKRMPELARGLGKSLRDFKRAREGVEDQIKRALEDAPAPAKKRIKADSATTTPEDTSVYDEAAGAAATAAATGGEDAPDDGGASESDETENADDLEIEDDYEVDPYEDEYIGGTAESDALAHGVESEADADAAQESEPAAQESAPETPDEPPPEKKQPDAGEQAADGGGI
ncbi:twin-arginine translocase TatA/TatE family subunit [Ereboglobus luteus]|uniref:Sec-independent protein translocase protein TatA n=1 Tax=Ereboglobus luteus TaxID=1796921 RepID=A0A2U8E776_9BACT|nr:twin-arginine translocase TatA/TatE family subunit [Ereboglobus luteus]AWI10696.1 hypothetical protein CKA38_13490 [Ereboglobus luteus]